MQIYFTDKIMIQDFEILGRTFSFYQIVALVGILLMGYFVIKECRRRELDDNEVIVFFLIIGIGVVVGSHILYALTQIRHFPLLFKVGSFKEFFQTAYYIFGGSVFYGGLLGGILAGVIFLHKKKLPFGDFADLAAPAAALFHAFGRLGCFFSGCCYGIECGFGVVYQYSAIPDANGVVRFPVQLCEACVELILFAVLWYFYRKKKYTGKLLQIYLMCYAVARFFLEFLRGDEYRGFLLGISTSQFISILILAGVILFEGLQRRKKRKDQTE